MKYFRKRDPNTGRQYWVDEHDIVQGIVKTGDARRDCEEYRERSQVEALARAWSWPPGSRIDKVEERPHGLTHDFDCTNSVTGERVAVEIKRFFPLATRAMKALHSKGCAESPPQDVIAELREHMEHANGQLANAQADRRCVLLIWQYEEEDQSAAWDFLRRALGCLQRHQFQHIDEVWLTMTDLTRFCRVHWD